ncbi:hypothetical protein [Acetivibrio cellulolyticus]
MSDKRDFDNGFGVCMFNIDKFEPFVDEIYESNDFSVCIEVYYENRIDGDSDACENYEQVEIIEIDNDNDLSSDEILGFILENKSIEEYEKILASNNFEESRYAINELINLLYIGNKMAYDALMNYFKTSEPARNIEQVHLRVKIIEALQYKASEKELIEHFINELLKTPSNNTTRKIYQQIFKYFERRSLEIVREPLINYLERSKCGPKMKSRVMEIIERKEIQFPF